MVLNNGNTLNISMLDRNIDSKKTLLIRNMGSDSRNVFTKIMTDFVGQVEHSRVDIHLNPAYADRIWYKFWDDGEGGDYYHLKLTQVSTYPQNAYEQFETLYRGKQLPVGETELQFDYPYVYSLVRLINYYAKDRIVHKVNGNDDTLLITAESLPHELFLIEHSIVDSFK